MKYLVVFMILIGFSTLAFADDVTNKESLVPFTLKVGEIANIDSIFHISFLSVHDDSRCPSDVTCIWQGTASVETNIKINEKDMGDHIISLGNDGTNQQNFDGYYVRLIQLEPYPISTMPIKQSEYVATFFVGNTNDVLVSPLQQIKNGIEPAAIKCKEGLILVLKHDSDSPACVKPKTANVLYERNWGSIPPPCCKH